MEYENGICIFDTNAFLDAITANDQELINKFKKAVKNNIDIVDCKGDTDLHRFASNGDFEAVKFLVKAGAQLNIENKKEYTALDYAIFN
jgi:ankyrin repeat protein